jgi:RNA polymerase sigma-70 factor (ECF subfamily)
VTDSSDSPSRLDAITTRWSVLQQAHGESLATANEARNALVLRYLPAVRRYVRALVQNEQDAEDLTQDVVVRLLAGDFAGADPHRGRFRDLLKVAIRNMVRNYWARGKRRKTVALDVEPFDGEEDEAIEDPWLSAWRRSVLDLAWKALEQEQRHQSGAAAYTLLRLRVQHPDDSSQQLSERLSRKIHRTVRPDATRQMLRRARLRFADLLLLELAKALENPTPERIEDEMIALDLLSPSHNCLGRAKK